MTEEIKKTHCLFNLSHRISIKSPTLRLQSFLLLLLFLSCLSLCAATPPSVKGVELDRYGCILPLCNERLHNALTHTALPDAM